MDIATLKKEIISKLKANIDAKKVEGAKVYYPTKMEILGVKVPVLKQILKNFKPEINQLSAQEKIQLIKDLINTNIFECQIWL